MRVDDKVPRLVLQEADEAAQIEFLDGQPQPITTVLAGPARLIKQIVKVAEDVRCLVDKIEIGLAVELAEGGVGPFEDIDIAYRRLRCDLAQGQLDSLGGAEMAGTDGCRQNKDARQCAHGSPCRWRKKR